MANRVSQETVEVLYETSGAKARVSQETVEVLYETSGAKARVSQAAVEVLGTFPKNKANRVSQVAVEVLQTAERQLPVTFAGSSSLAATLHRRRPVAPTFAGTSSLTATLSKISGVTKDFTATLAGSSSLAATLHRRRPVAPTFAGTSSLTATVTQTDYLTVEFAGTSELRIGPPGPVDLSPVDLAGSSTLTADFGLTVEFDGESSLAASFRRAQFVVGLNGEGHITFLSDLGPPGARLSQITNEVAYVGDAPMIVLSQVTLEVARPRPKGLFQAASV